VEARGEIITNNLPEFRELVREALGNINRDLKSDEDFGQAELDVKALKQAEDTVRAAALQAFDEKLKELVEGLNETAEEIRAPRLELEKLISKRKEEVKAEIIAAAMEKLDCAPRLRQSIYGKSVAEAIKGKRTLDSMQKALEVVITVHNGCIAKNRASIASFMKTHGEDLVPDREDLEVKSPDSVEGELRRRFEAKKATEERKRLEAEAAKAKAEAQAAIREAEAAKAAPVIKGMLPANDLPKPPKIGSIPVGNVGNVVPFNAPSEATTAVAEWAAFKSAVFTSFGPLKVAKDGLKHAENIIRAGEFAKAVNAAWQAANEPMAMTVREEVAK
jgi:hypothetical protein